MTDDLAKDLQASVRDFYERCAASFSRTRSHLVWPEEKIVAAKIKPGMTVVDVGAGNGRFAHVLPLNSIRYIGFEPSAGLRRSSVGTRHASTPPGGAAKDIDLRPGELPNISIDDATADVTVCFAVFHHIPGAENRKRAVDELIRITKPGGIIAATSWNPTRLKPSETPLTPLIRGGHGSDLPPPFARGGGNEGVSGGDPGDVWVPWTSGNESGKRYVHLMEENEWTELWTRPELTIETITKNQNWFVIVRKVL